MAISKTAETWSSETLGIGAYDYIVNEYDGSNNLTKTTYKMGGSTGAVVAIIEMTYDGSNNLISVERTT